MNEESIQRLALARQIGPVYAANGAVRAVVVHGSVGRGRADEYSDVELSIFWDRAPSEEERREAIGRAGGTNVQVWPLAEEDQEWSAEYEVAGVHIGTGEFLTDTVERFLTDVVDHYHTAVEKQLLIAVVAYGIPVYGEELVRQWQHKAASYPPGLTHAMVEEHLEVDLGSLEMLANRGDVLTLYIRLCETCTSILGILHGLNRIYLENPRFKWLRELAGEMHVAPIDLAARLEAVFRIDSAGGIAELRRITEESYDLVEQHLPGIDVGSARAGLKQPRRKRLGEWANDRRGREISLPRLGIRPLDY